MKKSKAGCLLVIAIVVGLVSVLLYPAITSSVLRGHFVKVGSRVRSIHLGIFEAAMEYEALNTNSAVGVVWPAEGQYKTSTDFLRAVLTNEYVRGIDFTFFGAPGLKVPKDTTDPKKFTAANNAWCVTLLPTNKTDQAAIDLHKETPFIFSRNIGFGSPPGPPKAGDTIADMTGLRKGTKLFGDKFGIIITFGGTVKFLNQKEFTQATFNPDGEKLKFLMP